ncbi:MAG: hypothetical protein COZ91_01940 [Candidatus Nealsonbacteria bacterium CG_4_8_14_3_um_filter_39_7]|uniref:Uncharacterized protein n=1 Tax=Candidatus Nealsonbacteria bacterium CG23_combo_of_CG06-09_8_20_14_all_39_17 TaxID=1974722 RepID=A0A2G9YUS3_9BACT|nr:MAG: hypothetical protein COX37_00975 [Candidatus Nealsonbacteria bacterium CG23_combo_of_CG06-09_8_20_14_all_39_17]PIW91160.1 MAG: hypothetical protein COZ91_01940 [Candidatus Nealsonbacteria bacterium CG_4_8_14_3_um_filter_39_7]
MKAKNIIITLLVTCLVFFAGANLAFGVGLCGGCGVVNGSDLGSCDNSLSCVNNKCEDPNSISFCSPIPSQDFKEVITGIIDMLFTLAIVVAPVMVLIGAFVFISSAGDAKKLKQGREIILYTVVGFVIILFAKAIVVLVETLVL